MKVLRSTLIVAAAVVTAACGDKVNVQGVTTPVPVVHSVTVAPATATLTNGQSVTLTAAVTADAGATTTPIVWSSSSSIASVTQGGVVTAAAAPAAGSVGICAAVGGATGCATILVTSGGGGGTGTTPAQLQIQSITGAGGLNCPVPVPPGSVGTAALGGACVAGVNVGSQLDVRLNLTANNTTPDSVVVFVDGKSAGKQTFSAAQASVIAATPRSGISEQITGVNLVISINIADCQTGTAATLNLQVVCGSTTNTPSWLNGTHTISAKVFGKFTGGSTATSSTAGQSITLLFANNSGFIGTVSITGTNGAGGTGSVVDAAGLLWKAGNMTLSAVPVIYTGQTVTFVTATYGGVGCTGASGNGIMVAPVAPSLAWTYTFSSTASSGTRITNAEMTAACAAVFLSAGEAPNVTAIGSDNDAIVLAPGGANGGAGFLNALVNLNADPALSVRMDNVAPQRATCLLNAISAPGTAGGTFPAGYPDGAILVGNALAANVKATNLAGTAYTLIQVVRQRGWINGVTLNANLVSGSDRIVTSCPDLGSGRLESTTNTAEETVQVRAGLVTDLNATIDASAPLASFAGMAETGTPNAYRARVAVKDKLGNTRTSFDVSNAPNDAANATAAHAILTGFAGIGTDATAAQTISADLAVPTIASSVSGFEFGLDMTAPALSILNTAQITVAGGGGRFNLVPGVDGGPGVTGTAAPSTVYLAQDNPNPATPTIAASTNFAAIPAPAWTSINRRDIVNGNLFLCDNFPGGAANSDWRSGSSTSCSSWVTGTQNIGRVAGGIGLLTQLQDPLTEGAAIKAAVGDNIDAYYTQLAQVVDLAGNASPTISNTIVLDNSPPSIGGLSYAPFLTAGGSVTFQSITTDNLDLQSERMNIAYDLIQPAPFTGTFAGTLFDANAGAAFAPTTALGGSTFWYPDVAVNTFTGNGVPAGFPLPAGPIPGTVQHSMAFAVNGFITQFQATGTINGTNGGALDANGRPNTANGFAVNQAGTATASASPIIPAALPGAGTAGTVAITNTGAAGFGPTQFVICGVGAACATPFALPAVGTIAVSRDGTTAGLPTTVTITAVATGTTLVFGNPFSQVQFYAYNPTAGATEGWRFIGSTFAGGLTDGGLGAPNGRNWLFSFTWDPTAVTAPSAVPTIYKIIAVGIGGTNLPLTSQGVALASPLAAVTVTINP